MHNLGKDTPLWVPYPEELKMTASGQIEVEVQQPTSWHVVMGAAGKVEKEVAFSHLEEDGVPLYKRKGGGGTVLLGPGTLVVTVHAGVSHTFRNLAYFEAINKALMDVFRTWKPLPYHQKGISDIAVGERKIVGSSIFRRKLYLLYQASILVDYDLPLMERLLKHPPREPDYRKGRGHEAFLTCLRELGITESTQTMAEDLSRLLPQFLPQYIEAVDNGPAT